MQPFSQNLSLSMMVSQIELSSALFYALRLLSEKCCACNLVHTSQGVRPVFFFIAFVLVGLLWGHIVCVYKLFSMYLLPGDNASVLQTIGYWFVVLFLKKIEPAL